MKNPVKHTSTQIQDFRIKLKNTVTAPFKNTIDSLSSYPVPDEHPILERLVKCKRYNLRQDSSDESEDPEIYIRNDDDGPIPALTLAPLPEQYHDLPKIDVSEIRVRECFPGSSWPYKMDGKDGVMFFKPLLDFKEPDFWRELDALARIYRAGGIGRLAGLKGIATTEGPSTLVGLLTTWIEGTKLCDIGIQERQSHSEEWCNQVLGTLGNLHQSDIIWGDANAHNVLIDRQNDAWIIDLDGGGRPEHQLQPSQANKETELEAVRKMFATLKELPPEESQWLGPFGPKY
ncbi:hypothetical protein KC332_g10154 [Hortaea werneckii]|nr:hypothetical protein KC350_g11866 [Hortaea werneckii]KAI6830577.1 hypothetical protein KC342_g8361 [Hortaea werneckii]KAI6968057.1 hypothetical protein KC329_g14268 [Hortaea werneckii]KAI7045489.1 hypothetical protein KC366_g3423 [Hortaea werneckii]KAI7060029.1 hypothetical protein KC327_g14916 [Hortaea werneckii]